MSFPPINRHQLVSRHDITLTNANERERFQIGNGAFALGLDCTGLQTFYGNTLSDWGWHSAPLPAGKTADDYQLEEYETAARKVAYATAREGQEEMYGWLRQNPHRLNLGRLKLQLRFADGRAAKLDDIENIEQKLELWTGLVTSCFRFDGEDVTVQTVVHCESDTVAVRVESALVKQGRVAIELSFPYGSHENDGADWDSPDAHTTTLELWGEGRAELNRAMDETRYSVSLAWEGEATIEEMEAHAFAVRPSQQGVLELSCRFGECDNASEVPDFAATRAASESGWEAFWMSGGAIDLSESSDPRWRELERRIVLSQYLLRAQEAGPLPPQESGLFCNSAAWNGKFHLEMHLWHGAQWALWNRWPLLQNSLNWYEGVLPSAREKAAQQGYRGARWPKMCGPDGRDSPSPCGPLLVWQQAHPIFYAELDYRLHPIAETLEKWREIIEESAEFMASFPVVNGENGFYDLVPPLKSVSENTEPMETYNPIFELSYWRFGLRIAQSWRERLGLERRADWDEVAGNLAPLPQQDGFYLQQQGMTETYSEMNWEHPALIGVSGLLPGDGVDAEVMRATVRRVFEEWQWDRCWGWDFPMMAMAAARNGEPEMAVSALLLDSPRNQFLGNGGATGGPFPYFPANGGLLYAVALMAAGWDGAPDKHAPGFPDNGRWIVRYENLRRAI